MQLIDEETRKVETRIDSLNIDEVSYMVFFDLVKLVNPKAYYHNLKDGLSPKSLIGNISLHNFERREGNQETSEKPHRS
jgi:hypothetical protein